LNKNSYSRWERGDSEQREQRIYLNTETSEEESDTQADKYHHVHPRSRRGNSATIPKPQLQTGSKGKGAIQNALWD